MPPFICAVYKSPKKSELYLYVPKKEDFSRVPAELLQHFGKPVLVTVLALTPGRQFARVEPQKLQLALETQGFYLQMPPTDAQQRVAW